jgi:hypothetical protein
MHKWTDIRRPEGARAQCDGVAGDRQQKRGQDISRGSLHGELEGTFSWWHSSIPVVRFAAQAMSYS